MAFLRVIAPVVDSPTIPPEKLSGHLIRKQRHRESSAVVTYYFKDSHSVSGINIIFLVAKLVRMSVVIC